MIKKISTVMILAIVALSVQAQDIYFDAIKKDIAKYNTARINEDFETYVDYINDEVVSKAGGTEAMVTLEREKATVNKSVGFSTISAEPISILEVVPAGKQLHTILTQEEVIQVADRDFMRTGYFLAVSDDAGESWKFLDLEPYTQEGIKAYITDFNDTLVIPSPEPAILITKK